MALAASVGVVFSPSLGEKGREAPVSAPDDCVMQGLDRSTEVKRKELSNRILSFSSLFSDIPHVPISQNIDIGDAEPVPQRSYWFKKTTLNWSQR